MSEYPTTITLPLELAKKIEERIKGTSFNSVSAYVNYILRQVLSAIEREQKDTGRGGLSETHQKEVDERMRRLESLGYLD